MPLSSVLLRWTAPNRWFGEKFAGYPGSLGPDETTSSSCGR